MKSIRFIFALILAASLAINCGCSESTNEAGSENPPDTLQYLFVQSADSGSFVPSKDEEDIYILTLNGTEPVTTFFSDRPYRLSGYITTSDFIASWDDTSDDGFLKDPPNAAIQIAGAPAAADVVIVELLGALYDQNAGTLKYRTKIVRKTNDSIELFHSRGDAAESIPENFGQVSLFIDSWYSKAWHKVKKVVTDTTDDVKKAAKKAEEILKKAVSDFEQALKAKEAALVELEHDPFKMVDMTDETFFKLISIVLPKGLGKCLNVVPGPPIFDIAVLPSSTDCYNWMSKLPPAATVRELGDLALPGSHDSGTYPINGLSPLTTEFGNGNNYYDGLLLAADAIKPLFPPAFPVMGSLTNWSRAQRHTIGAQLTSGVRYFDLRMIPDPSGQFFFATHMFAGAEIDVILADLIAFTTLNPSEIIILDFQHLFSRSGEDNGMSGTDAEALVTRLMLAFGNKLVTADATANPKTMKLSDLWSAGLQVVAIFDPAARSRMTTFAQSKVWSGDKNAGVITRYWPQTTTWFGTDGIQQFLDTSIVEANKHPNNFIVFQGQMTPNPPASFIKKRVILSLTRGVVKAQLDCLKATSGIAADLLSSVTKHLDHLTAINVALSLQEEARATNPELRLWVENNRPRHIVIADFIADYPDLIKTIIDTN